MNESTADRLIDSIARHKADSNRNLWILAHHAYKLVGYYEQGAVQAIAQAAGVSTATVRAWALAYRCFVECVRFSYLNTKYLRRRLSLTHFRVAYEMGQKYNIDVLGKMIYLRLMYDNKITDQPWSVDVLRQEIEADYNHKPADWRWFFNRMNLDALRSFDGELPPLVKRWAALGVRIRERLE